jgi:hypothetical protein
MEIQDFTMTLISSASKHIYPDNTAASFTHEVAEVIRLPPVDTRWEVALMQAILPAKVYNINENCSHFEVLHKSDQGTVTKQEATVFRREPLHIAIGKKGEKQPITIAEFCARIMRQVPDALRHDFNIAFHAEQRTIEVTLRNKMLVQFHDYDVFALILYFPDRYLKTQVSESFTVNLPNIPELLFGNSVPVDPPLKITLIGYASTGFQPVTRLARDDKLFQLQLPPGCYYNATNFVNRMQALINKALGKNETDKLFVKIIYTSNGTIHVHLGTNHFIRFTDDLADIVGFPRNKWLEEKDQEGAYPLDLDHYLSTVNLYIPTIMQHQYVGDTKGPLIASFPLKKLSNSRTNQYSAWYPLYYPVATTQFREITVLIVDDKGDLLSFPTWAQTSLTLHFRVKP